MKHITDEEVLNAAKRYEWDKYVITVTGEAYRVGLIFVRLYPKNPYEDIQFCTLEKRHSPEETGDMLVRNWASRKTPREPLIKYVRHVNVPGFGGQHVMIRMSASSNEGELFRCIGCGEIRTGYANLAAGDIWSPYSLKVPMITEEKRGRKFEVELAAWKRFMEPCRSSDPAEV